MSPLIIVSILLAISVALNGVQAKLLIAAHEATAKVQQAYDSFTADVKVKGEEAQSKADAEKMADKLKKDTADAENAATVARLTSDIGKLRKQRDARPGGNIVSAAPAGAIRPELACYDRAALESALRGFLAEARGLVDEGAAATLNLDTARRWAHPQ